jgi:hypothetical protein
VAWLQGAIMGLLPGKPFSLDNYRSLTIDSVCSENGCAKLGIQPEPMLSLLPTYLPSPDQPDAMKRLPTDLRGVYRSD